MNYTEALEYIASLVPRGWRLGLDRMEEFVRCADLSDNLGAAGGPQFIHVAGTNGKGSVTAYLQSMLVESGWRTGAFFSPFVYDIRERVQFGRELISEVEMAKLTEALKPIGESLAATEFGGVTEFEFKTALGFLYWKLKRCEWVALEVGLGGRLDATNVVTPRASVIVSIGLDHTAILGETHAKIAYEKAGIIKPGVPVIVGQMPDEAREVILSVAKEKGSPAWLWNRDIKARPDPESPKVIIETPVAEHSGLTVGLPGALQGQNLALAVAAMDAAGATRTLKGMQVGSRKASLPGRFEVRTIQGKTMILDGAHNADAAVVLRESLAQYLWSRTGHDVKAKTKVVLVTAMVAGHDPIAFYEPLLPVLDAIYVVPIEFHRALDPSSLAKLISERTPNVRAFETLLEGVTTALEDTTAEDVILVAGSFYLVGEVGRTLGYLKKLSR